MDDIGVDEDNCFLLSLLPSFRQFNDEQKFLAPMEILKITRHVKLQQNLDRYSSSPRLALLRNILTYKGGEV